MRILNFRRVNLALALLAFVMLAHSASAEQLATPSGNMNAWRPALGKRLCTMRAASAGVSVKAPDDVVTVAPSGGNTIQWSTHLSNFSEISYFGYSKKEGVWWEADADNDGDTAFLRSNNGITFTQTSDSSTSIDRSSARFQVRYDVTKDRLSELQSVDVGGEWRPELRVICTRP